MAAQLNIVIDSVSVSHIIKIRSSRIVFMEGFYEGPTIRLYFSMINGSSTDTVCLTPSQTKMELLFRYQNKAYQFAVFPIFGKSDENGLQYDSLCFYNDTVVLKPNQKKEYFFSDKYLMSIHKRTDCDTVSDYTSEVIETLPTLQIRCSNVKYEAVSSGISKVTVQKFPVYYYPPQKDKRAGSYKPFKSKNKRTR